MQDFAPFAGKYPGFMTSKLKVKRLSWNVSIIVEIFACATHFSPPRGLFRTEARGCTLVCMILLRDFVPELNFRSSSGTGVSSRRYDSFLYDILWRYHVNEFRATRGNQSELAPDEKSPFPDIMQTPSNFVLSCGFAVAIYFPTYQI